MNILHNPPSDTALTALSAMQSAVKKTLEKKQMLGQYAVFWKNGKVFVQHYDRRSEATKNQADDE